MQANVVPSSYQCWQPYLLTGPTLAQAMSILMPTLASQHWASLKPSNTICIGPSLAADVGPMKLRTLAPMLAQAMCAIWEGRAS